MISIALHYFTPLHISFNVMHACFLLLLCSLLLELHCGEKQDTGDTITWYSSNRLQNSSQTSKRAMLSVYWESSGHRLRECNICKNQIKTSNFLILGFLFLFWPSHCASWLLVHLGSLKMSQSRTFALSWSCCFWFCVSSTLTTNFLNSPQELWKSIIETPAGKEGYEWTLLSPVAMVLNLSIFFLFNI